MNIKNKVDYASYIYKLDIFSIIIKFNQEIDTIWRLCDIIIYVK